ncbi:hypothetical protein BV20DRAFT_94412 [Pilatotrama ljubarskyi]|nr:hypothetical protein BV20DRAFT_94412 [Pilatotrama ljubarskyi]
MTSNACGWPAVGDATERMPPIVAVSSPLLGDGHYPLGPELLSYASNACLHIPPCHDAQVISSGICLRTLSYQVSRETQTATSVYYQRPSRMRYGWNLYNTHGVVSTINRQFLGITETRLPILDRISGLFCVQASSAVPSVRERSRRASPSVRSSRERKL